MAGFEHVLRKAEPALRLPVGRRTRVLLELGQDLEDLYAAYRARGMDAAEARVRAAAVLGLSSESAESLTALHTPWWMAMLDRFSGAGGRSGERALLAGLSGLAVLLGAVALRAGEVWRAGPVVSLGVLACLAGAIGWTGACWLRLWRRDDRGVAAYATLPIAGLAAIAGTTGLLGGVIELHDLARQVEEAGAWQSTSAVAKLADAAMLVTLGVTVMLLILLVWLPLHRAARRVEAERALLASWPVAE